MGNCGGCSGGGDNCADCTDCTCATPQASDSVSPVGMQRSGGSQLFPKKKIVPRLASLDDACPHYEYEEQAAFRCFQCLKAWVRQRRDDDQLVLIAEDVAGLHARGYTFTAGRLLQAAEDVGVLCD